ncbi:MAG: hypothetical protein GF350_14760 [Chitinivibrionales bacterium]|nr:hypothetical protein [Chitinivibrionales bacterium]
MEHSTLHIAVSLILAGFIVTVSAQDIPVFPGAEGFGTTTPAGRGGELIKVTTLAADGPGSLKEAVSASGKRTIVFEVSGVIDLRSKGSRYLSISNPYCTIAGQTAPPPGITILGSGFSLRTHDILIQHLAIRIGDHPGQGSSGDSFLLLGSSNSHAANIVIDHCSCSWATDKIVIVWTINCDGVTHDATFSNCIFGEALQCAHIHKEQCHSKGFLIGDGSENITVKNCLFTDNWDRNPAIKGKTSSQIVNNLVYNPGAIAIVITESSFCGSGPVKSSLVGNVLKSGKKTRLIKDHFIGFEGALQSSGTKIYATKNVGDTNFLYQSHPEWYPPRFDSISTVPPEHIANTPQEAAWSEPMTVMPSSEVYEYVLNNAGFRPVDGDSTDKRMIKEVINRWGMIIDSLDQLPDDGMPPITGTTRPFEAPQNYNADDDGDGYTNLEEVLHQMAAEVEGSGRLLALDTENPFRKPGLAVPGRQIKGPDLFLSFSEEISACAVYSAMGECMFRRNRLNQKEISLPIGTIPRGLYMVGFTTKDGKKYSRKFIRH